MRPVHSIVVHCSASDNPDQDSIEAVRDLHTSPSSKKIKWGDYDTQGRGWSDIGYHYLIDKRGDVHPGRPEEVPGAHVRGHNSGSVGVCLSGERDFTPEQFRSLERLCLELTQRHGLEKKDILAHRDLDPGKTCPNFALHGLVAGWPWH